MSTYSIAVNGTGYDLSLSRTGGQGSKGDSITNVYVDANENLLVDISDSAGNVVSTVNLGSIATLVENSVETIVSEIILTGEQVFITVTQAETGEINFEVNTDQEANPNTIVERTSEAEIKTAGIKFDTSANIASTEGTLAWNSTDGTLNLGLKGDTVVLQLGQESIIKARNSSVNEIVNGKIVYISGADQGRPTINLASNSSEANSQKVIGVATENIAGNNVGYITTEGLVRNIDTSAFSAGDALYLGSNGAFTNTVPETPLRAVFVGWCVTSDATTGSVFVKVQNNPELNELDDVLINNPVNNSVIAYNDNLGYWTNLDLDTLFATDAALAAVQSSLTTALSTKSNVGHTHTLNELSDVTVALTGASYVLKYDLVTNKFVSARLNSGDVFGLSTLLDAKLDNTDVGVTVQGYSAVLDNTTASYTIAEETKLAGIETNADVTDTANVTAAGALMTTGGTMTGNLVLNADPTVALQAATKSYVDTIAASGIQYHEPVRVESPVELTATYDNGTSGVGATLTNSGTQAALVIDGVTLSLNDRVLVYRQSNAAHNGVYTVTDTGSGSTNWILTRSTDTDSYGPSDPSALGQGDAFFVTEGNTGAGELYVMNTVGTITFGTTGITFTQVASTAVYTAGTGLTLNGTEFNIDGTVLVDSDIGTTVQGYSSVLANTTASYTTTEESKLAGIEAGATADQTGAEIKALYEAEVNTNAYTDAEKAKLAGIEESATADQTPAEIKTAYESNADTNAYTDAEKTKLAGIEAGADVTDTANVTAAGALMDSEVTNLLAVKTFDPADYATAEQGALADSAIQPNDSPTFGTTNTTIVDFGDWTITESAGSLYFATGGVNKMKLDASGNLQITGTIDTVATIS